MRPIAAAELPWYFGLGAQTAMGDCGLKSTLGGQLDAIRDGTNDKRTVDASRAEDEMIGRLGVAKRMAIIRARLGQLSDEQRLVLRLHFGERPIHSLSGAAVLSPLAVVLCCGSVTREAIRSAVGKSIRAKDSRWIELEAETMAIVAAAVLAYESSAWVKRR
jgi:hypothetical protein